MTAPCKSYFLVPNFSIPPDGPLLLGNIIADACQPVETLLAPAPQVLDRDNHGKPKIHSTAEKGWHYDRSTYHGSPLGAWAKFLDLLKIGFDGERGGDATQKYSCAEMQTEYFQPNLDMLMARVEDPVVKGIMAMRTGGLGPRRSVYMVTGLMIARGLAIEAEAGQEQNFNANLEANAAALSGGILPLGAGAKAGHKFGTRVRASVEEVIGDRVFGYQLCRLWFSGLGKKARLQADPHRKGAFYSLDEDDGAVGGETETLDVLENLGALGVSQLEDELDDSLEANLTGVLDGEKPYRCVSIKQRWD